MVNTAKVPLEEAVKMASLTPARVMRIDQSKGSITPGKDADIIVFNENIQVQLVMINGEVTINHI
jgi:N-acetylglucosamine-6-phosphate deacetylase